MSSRILIIGANGQLGRDMMRLAQAAGHVSVGVDVPDIDIVDPESVRRVVAASRPGVVINCAAYTDVDGCESRRELAFSVNGEGAGNCARAAREAGALIVHISTDYVFDGAASAPYVEGDTPRPQSVYGESKLQGELRVAAEASDHQIFRIAWLYGTQGKNFVYTIRRIAADRAQRGEPLKIVNDQFGSPTYTVEVCRQILRVMHEPVRGILHSTAEGSCSRLDFARHIVTKAGIAVDLIPCTTADFPRPAQVPARGVLENARLKTLGLNVMKPWEDAFAEFLDEERQRAASTHS